MIYAELVHMQAFWYKEQEESVVQNSNQNSYKYSITCILYIYAIVCWGSKRSSGRSSRKLIIKGKGVD